MGCRHDISSYQCHVGHNWHWKHPFGMIYAWVESILSIHQNWWDRKITVECIGKFVNVIK
jgi:hypothetical protein